jgi:hypothetical protein
MRFSPTPAGTRQIWYCRKMLKKPPSTFGQRTPLIRIVEFMIKSATPPPSTRIVYPPAAGPPWGENDIAASAACGTIRSAAMQRSTRSPWMGRVTTHVLSNDGNLKPGWAAGPAETADSMARPALPFNL